MMKFLRKIKNWFRSREPEKYKPLDTPIDVTPGVGAPDWLLRIALETTGSFEGQGYGQITGNFDKQGMSWGILQWCIGQGSLQEKILRPFMQKHDSVYIDRLHLAELCNLPIKKAVALAASLFKSPEYRLYAKQFMLTPEVKALQVEAAQELGSKAWKLSTFYFGGDTEQEHISFLWFFDVLVQNGSLKGINKPDFDVMEEVLPKALDKINWGVGEMDYLQKCLLTWSYLRAKKSNSKYFSDVLYRKATVALGFGRVHGTRYSGLHTEVKEGLQ